MVCNGSEKIPQRYFQIAGTKLWNTIYPLSRSPYLCIDRLAHSEVVSARYLNFAENVSILPFCNLICVTSDL
jgi:hypothetical protein